MKPTIMHSSIASANLHGAVIKSQRQFSTSSQFNSLAERDNNFLDNGRFLIAMKSTAVSSSEQMLNPKKIFIVIR
ncbi:unnamed protein product [Orchesella dallaii]|uniref:Uncharacterized protein n=1 Tax=Orchesella dallaii TaxID=48710 RepID=A0ABP1RE51_9HEXA